MIKNIYTLKVFFCTTLFCSVLFFSACSVGPDFVEPVSEIQTPFLQEDQKDLKIPSKTVSKEITIKKWWETFNDATLVSLIDRAIKSNLDLKQATARIRQARAIENIAITRVFPEINLSGVFTRSKSANRISNLTVNPNSQNFQSAQSLYKAGIDASWELDIFGGIRRDIEAASADLSAQEDNQRDVFVTLASEVALNYLNLRGTQMRLDITKENLASQENTTKITRVRFEAGFASELDVVNAEAQSATTKSQIPILEAQEKKFMYTLSTLLALEPQMLVAELSNEGSIKNTLPKVPPEIPIGLPSDLIERRPDIRQAASQLHAATARVGVATADLFPKFSLTGSVGVQGNKESALTDWAKHFWSFGPAVDLPIFDAGRRWAQVKVQDALLDQALLDYQKSVLNALNEVASTLIDYSREQERYKALTIATEANQKAVELAQKLYTNGLTDFLSVLIAERSLYSSQDSLVQSTITVDTNLVALYKALGGGWEEDAP